MNDRIRNAASVVVLVSFGIVIGAVFPWLFIRTEAALLKAADAQASQTALVKDLTEKILPAMQQQIDGILSTDAFSEP